MSHALHPNMIANRLLVLSLGFLLSPAVALAYGYLLVNSTALNNFAAPYGRQVSVNETCSFGDPSITPCSSPVLSVIAGPTWLGTSVGFAAARSDLARAQLQAFSSGNGGYFDGSDASAQLGDVVRIDLAPGASWPQSFVVRIVVDGRFSKPIIGGPGSVPLYRASFRANSFPEPGLDVGTVFIDAATALPIVHEKEVTLSEPTAFFVDGWLLMNSISQTPITMDFSSGSTSGLRFEVDLPSDLVMTSDSGVFLTAAIQPGCANGLDDDYDGSIDVGAGDPGCADPDDTSERGASICDNGLDDDADGLADHPADIGCEGPNGTTEAPEPGLAALLAAGLLWLARLGAARGRRGVNRSVPATG